MAKKKNYSKEFKAKVALEAIKEDLTLSQISSKFKVHSTQVNRWKKELLSGAKDIFGTQKDQQVADLEKEVNVLYKQVGKLVSQNDFLQEKLFP